MDIQVFADGWVEWPGTDGTVRARCALGRGGVAPTKREGDGVTPVGCFPVRSVLYRPDRGPPPATALAVASLTPASGWCDDPAHGDYNRAVTLPHPARCETLWRDDALYDVILVLGYNDDPPVAGLGSAIFVHRARDAYAPTEGCVALAPPDLAAMLAALRPGDRVCINPQ